MKSTNASGRTSAMEKTSGLKRWGRSQRAERQDPYKLARKLTGAYACPQCGAVYLKGRWQWRERPKAARQRLCQACERTNHRFPAGIVTLRGKAVTTHKDELLALIRNQEGVEKNEHPLNRLMKVDTKTVGEITIWTTDIHLPHRIAHAVKRAYRGTFREKFDPEGYMVRIDWESPP